MEDQNTIPIMPLDYYALRAGTEINSQWLELPISLISHGPKGVRATEVPLYCGFIECTKNSVDPNQLASSEAS